MGLLLVLRVAGWWSVPTRSALRNACPQTTAGGRRGRWNRLGVASAHRPHACCQVAGARTTSAVPASTWAPGLVRKFFVLTTPSIGAGTLDSIFIASSASRAGRSSPGRPA